MVTAIEVCNYHHMRSMSITHVCCSAMAHSSSTKVQQSTCSLSHLSWMETCLASSIWSARVLASIILTQGAFGRWVHLITSSSYFRSHASNCVSVCDQYKRKTYLRWNSKLIIWRSIHVMILSVLIAHTASKPATFINCIWGCILIHSFEYAQPTVCISIYMTAEHAQHTVSDGTRKVRFKDSTIQMSASSMWFKLYNRFPHILNTNRVGWLFQRHWSSISFLKLGKHCPQFSCETCQSKACVWNIVRSILTSTQMSLAVGGGMSGHF